MRKKALAVLLAGLAAASSLRPATAQFDEDLVKAATILNVALFVDWPGAPAADPFVVAVLAADDQLARALISYSTGRKFHDREIRIRRLGSSDDACACHLLFVAAQRDDRSGTLLKSARAQPVLTIGETTAFLREGGMVRIFRDDNRLRLQIDAESAGPAGLRFSSRLLSLAVRSR
jgi:hypothetical protein